MLFQKYSLWTCLTQYISVFVEFCQLKEAERAQIKILLWGRMLRQQGRGNSKIIRGAQLISYSEYKKLWNPMQAPIFRYWVFALSVVKLIIPWNCWPTVRSILITKIHPNYTVLCNTIQTKHHFSDIDLSVVNSYVAIYIVQ